MDEAEEGGEGQQAYDSKCAGCPEAEGREAPKPKGGKPKGKSKEAK